MQYLQCFYSQKKCFDISCKLSPEETICLKCQSLFSGEIKKNIVNLSSAELAQRVVKVKASAFTCMQIGQGLNPSYISSTRYVKLKGEQQRP